MSSAANTYITDELSIEANSVDPEQTAPTFVAILPCSVWFWITNISFIHII